MRRILVVDDDVHIRLAIRAWLMRYGFRVAMADGGPNGLAALDDFAFDDPRRIISLASKWLAVSVRRGACTNRSDRRHCFA